MPPKSHGNKRGGRGVGAGNPQETKQVQGHKERKNISTVNPTPIKMIYVPPPPPPEPISSRISPLEFISLICSIDVPPPQPPPSSSSSSLSSSSASAYQTRGIENPRNLCFRNVIIQSLLAVSPFRNFLHSLAMLCPSENVPEGEFTAWKEMIYLAEEVKIENDNSTSPDVDITSNMDYTQTTPVLSVKGATESDSNSEKNRNVNDSSSLYQELLKHAEREESQEKSIIPEEDDGWEEVSFTNSKKNKKNKNNKVSAKVMADSRMSNTTRKDVNNVHKSGCNSSNGSHHSFSNSDSSAYHIQHNLIHQAQSGNVNSCKVMPSVMSQFMLKMRRLNGSSVDCSNASSLVGMSQEDAMEFMTYLLDTLHEELLVYEGNAGQIPDNGDDMENADNFNDGWEEVTSSRLGRKGKQTVDENSRKEAIKVTASTPISRLFHGTIRSEFKQKGSMLSVTFQRFHCLTLEIRDFSRPNSFISSTERALEAFFKPEHIQDANAVKCANLDVLPPVLVLQLNRFTFDPYKGTPIKIDADVTFPLELELSDRYFTTDLKIKQNDKLPIYSLCAVVMHHGNRATGGHYTMYAKACVGALIWRRIDDTRVVSVSEEEVLSARRNAYLLFYCKTAI